MKSKIAEFITVKLSTLLITYQKKLISRIDGSDCCHCAAVTGLMHSNTRTHHVGVRLGEKPPCLYRNMEALHTMGTQ